MLTPFGNTEVTSEDITEGKIKATIAAREMGRIEPHHQVRDERLIRNWSQVKYAEAIYAIGTLLKKDELMNYGKSAKIIQVSGGTGYAVQMAINENKPVYVFEQVRNFWASNINKKWNKCDTPTLTLNYAGVGTREINNLGENAIRAVYEKTLKNI